MLVLCELEDVQSTLNNLSRRWQHIKGCHSKDEQRVQNVVIPRWQLIPFATYNKLIYSQASIVGISNEGWKEDYVLNPAWILPFGLSLT